MANKATSAPAATQAAGPQEPKAPGLFEIGELRKKHKVGRAVFAGVCSAQGWKPGKAVTEEEFLEAIEDEAEFDQVAAIFMERLSDSFEFTGGEDGEN